MRQSFKIILKKHLRHFIRHSSALRALIATLCISAFWAFTHQANADVVWTQKEPGLEFGAYSVNNNNSMLLAQVILVRIDPKLFSFTLSSTHDNTNSGINKNSNNRQDIRTLTTNANGIIGINANFFDPNGKALGLLSKNGEKLNPLHQGGNVLTGIFFIHNDKPRIVHRFDSIPTNNVALALQAGPRLIVDGKPTDLTKSTSTARRSGIAITQDFKIVIFASVSPLPGILLSNIQEMLLKPSIKATDALNLDGGSSSQIYISASVSLTGKEIFFGGADTIPVGLIVTRKATKNIMPQ